MDDINALLKGITGSETSPGIDLDDIADIAGDNGEKLVQGVNNIINGIGFMDEATGETTYLNLLPADFFEKIAQYAITYTASDVETIADKIVKVVDTIEPDPELVEKYEQRYQEFKRIYPTIKSLY
jgi:hypothetical protein